MSKLCVIIGGSKGLGRALSALYEQNHFQIAEFSRTGQGYHHLTTDLSRREVAIDSFDEYLAPIAKQDWDEVHLLMNAATLAPIGPLYMSEPKQWWQHVDVNLTLPISILGRFQWHFKDHPARKVVGYVSSGAATTAFDGWSLYGATKAGMAQFIRCMALEQDRLPQPIQCAILDPGVMDTDMQASIRESDSVRFSQHEAFVERYRADSLGDAANVATNIFQCLSEPFDNGCSFRVADY